MILIDTSNSYPHKGTHQKEYRLLSHPDTLLKDHLRHVANACKNTIEDLHLLHKDIVRTAYLIGACHDIGKGTPYFQRYILGDKGGDVLLKSHAMISSIYCSWVLIHDKQISEANRKFLAFAASLVIQGHHGCLKSQDKYYDRIIDFRDKKIFENQIESFKFYRDEMETITTHDLGLMSFSEFCRCWHQFLSSVFKNLVLSTIRLSGGEMEPYFVINMLFSALIDADTMDAAKLDRPPRLELDCEAVRNYIKNFKQEKEIDIKRKRLFDQVNICPTENRIYTFTADTGLGKTLTIMNFALNLRNGNKRRIIYVAPFLSIIDQNMEKFQDVFKHDMSRNSNLILTHHHLANVKYEESISEKEYSASQSELLTHGWNGEIIGTTLIQFFNMVHGRWTSQLRRFDNTIGSIVILDEVQSIPFSLWKIVREDLLYLANKLNYTVILVTATQPLIFLPEDNVKEIADQTLSKLPQRVTFLNCIRLDKDITLDDFCDKMNELILNNKDKNLMIELNTIFTAEYVFDNITSKAHDIRFLSSQVIPFHRRPRINEIKQQLTTQKKVILVTTQVIEAGVDIDFDIGVRDIGPIDSIVQAAGRVNREFNRAAKDSPFYVYRIIDDRRDFRPEHAKYVYHEVAIEIVKSILTPSVSDIQSLVSRYYQEVRRRQSMNKSDKIYGYITNLDYEHAEKEFNILDEAMYKQPLFIEFDDNATEVWEKYLVLLQAENGGQRRRSAESIQLRNEMGQYMINVNAGDIERLGLLHTSGIFKIDRDRINELYDKEKGFISLAVQA